MKEILSEEILNRIFALSPREMITFRAIGQGLATKELASIDGYKCSIKTIETHIAHMRQKLESSGISHLRMLATRFIVHCEVNNLCVKQIRYSHKNFKLEPNI